jgi:hypothetical protein
MGGPWLRLLYKGFYSVSSATDGSPEPSAFEDYLTVMPTMN